LAVVEQAEEKAEALGLSNITFLVADVEDVTFDNASFDSILSASAIPYLQDVKATFGKFSSWLRPGGRFVFNTPQACPQIRYHLNSEDIVL
jgi:ubiquinone/menaquinone biosynthesis C-methylase UbiE